MANIEVFIKKNRITVIILLILLLVLVYYFFNNKIISYLKPCYNAANKHIF